MVFVSDRGGIGLVTDHVTDHVTYRVICLGDAAVCDHRIRCCHCDDVGCCFHGNYHASCCGNFRYVLRCSQQIVLLHRRLFCCQRRNS